MKPSQVILHHSLTRDSGTVSWQAIRKYHVETKGWAGGIGYQLGLEDINGQVEILLGRMLDEPGAHTVSQNDNSIGICCVGNFDETEMSEAMFQKLYQLCASLMRIFNIPITGIRRHAEFAPKTCPGMKFPFGRLLAALQKELNANT